MIRTTSRLIPLAALSFLIQWSGCATRQTAVAPQNTIRATAVVENGERQLLHALVRRDHAGVSQFLASDFTCTVTGEHHFTLNRTAARYSVCAGMGQDLSARASLPGTGQVWTTLLATNFVSGGVLTYVDTNARTLPQRFYRIVPGP